MNHEPLPGQIEIDSIFLPNERRQLQEIEQALCRDDPEFGRLMRAGDPRVRYARKLMRPCSGS